MILAGDIGGTKSNLALLEKKGDSFRAVFIHRYASQDYTRFEDIIGDFLARGSMRRRGEDRASRVWDEENGEPTPCSHQLLR